MRRFYIVDDADQVVAEGVQFLSGAVTVSFVSASEQHSVSVHTSMEQARYVHVALGRRRIAWRDRRHQDAARDSTTVVLDGDNPAYEFTVALPGGVL